MKSSSEALTDLIKFSYDVLSDEHLGWDEWGLEWQEHSRKKPTLEYTQSVWAMTKGYLDALYPTASRDAENNIIQPSYRRALFREQATNLALLHLKHSETNIVEDIENLKTEIKDYFHISKLESG